MKNFDYEKKYHYFVKYFVIAFPLIFVLVLCLLDTLTYSDYISLIDEITLTIDVHVNHWYFNLLEIVGLHTLFENGGIFAFLLVYPLYVFWVYVLDLILDIFAFVPKLAHKLMYKLGGN